MALLMDKTLGVSDQEVTQRRRGQELRKLLVQSKSVALIKSGQAASLRPDLIRSAIWAEELGKLVDAVGSFPDLDAMKIVQAELIDLEPRLRVSRSSWKKSEAYKNQQQQAQKRRRSLGSFESQRVASLVERDDILSLFDFDNDYRAVASASIGQVYKARIRGGLQLEAAIGKEQALKWGGRVVAIKVQRPDAEASASMDMYLLRRAAIWLGKLRSSSTGPASEGSNSYLPQIADAFGMQLFGELDYNREANNCERFRDLYGDWNDVIVPSPCMALTRRKVLVMDWIDGTKGPWDGQEGIE
jgi:predicted unusual protein kinase regulating ubiquinone biosynthesis (AarF/ABC1/UbiB family)